MAAVKSLAIVTVCLYVVLMGIDCQESPSAAQPGGQTSSSSTSTAASTTSAAATTTLSPEEDCALGNSSCEACVGRGVKCLYCSTSEERCRPYPVGQIIPNSKFCKLSDAKWGVCWVNYEALLITMGVIGGVLLITVACCCYCCCCKSNKSAMKKYKKEEAKLEREADDRRNKHDERKKERQGRMDEIRRKYGLLKDGEAPYERFDA